MNLHAQHECDERRDTEGNSVVEKLCIGGRDDSARDDLMSAMLSRDRSTGSIRDESEKQEEDRHEWIKELHREGVPLA
jgi:hypothetical protein